MSNDNNESKTTEEVKVESPKSEATKSTKKAPPKPEEKDSRITAVIGVLILVLVIGAFFLRQGDNLGNRTVVPDPNGEVQEIITEDYQAKALELVQEDVGAESKVKMTERLHLLKEKMKQDNSDFVVTDEKWEVAEVKDAEETNRFYEVSFSRTEGEQAVVYMWRVDLKEKTIEAVSESAAELAKMEEYFLTASQKPGDVAADTDAADVKPDQAGIDSIPPPADVPPPVTDTAGAVTIPQDVAISDPAPIPPMFFSEDPPFELTGVMKIGGSYKAMLQKDGRAYNASVGEKLPENWIVSEIGDRSVTLKKGTEKHTLKMKDTGIKPPPPRNPSEPYPQAVPQNTPPGEAPPIPPVPGDSISRPDTQPTLIPLN
jgi:hypothetical protein